MTTKGKGENLVDANENATAEDDSAQIKKFLSLLRQASNEALI